MADRLPENYKTWTAQERVDAAKALLKGTGYDMEARGYVMIKGYGASSIDYSKPVPEGAQ